MNKIKLSKLGFGWGKLVAFAVFALLLFPAVAWGLEGTTDDAIDNILALLNRVIPLIFVLALIYFLWGLANYILKADQPGEREKAVQLMLWGIIILVVMVSVWAIVNIVTKSFDLDRKRTNPDAPQFN